MENSNSHWLFSTQGFKSVSSAKQKTQTLGLDSLFGRQEATDIELLEPLANSILQHWDFAPLAEEFSDLDKLFAPAYNLAYEY